MNRYSLIFLLGGSLLVGGCATETKANAAEPDTLKAGTQIKAVLMRTLVSGASDEGEEVPLVVAEDVKGAGGKVVVPKGSSVKAVVSWSRGEGSLDGIIGRPARLHIRFVETKAVDGTAVPLASDDSLKPDSSFELNRDNTGRVEPSAKTKAILEDPANEEALRSLASLLQDGTMDEGLKTPEQRAKLGTLLTELGLERTAEAAKQDKLSNLGDMLREAGKGSNLLALSAGQAPLALDAAIEVAKFATSIPNRLGKALQGRSIKAHIGTQCTAYVAKDVSVTHTEIAPAN